ILAGFLCQTAFLYVRGEKIGRCPLTNFFELFIFLSWAMVLFYLLIGPTYRLSLLGFFTSPFVFLFQLIALAVPGLDRSSGVKIAVNPWMELHAAGSIVAYGAFLLAGVAGVMYLVQERQLKTHHLHSIFFHLPPLTDLFAAITRLLWWGFVLYTLGVVSGFFTGGPLPRVQLVAAIGVWLLYAAILQGRHLRRLAPKRVATLCILGFTAALMLLWGISFSAQSQSSLP